MLYSADFCQIVLQCLHKPWEWLLLIGQFLMLSKEDKTIILNLTSYLSEKLQLAYLILWLKAKCLLKNCAVYSQIYIEFQLLHFLGGTNTSVKFVTKITRLFRGQIDPLIIFGWDILNFIAGLAQWRGLAQTLEVQPEQTKIHKTLHDLLTLQNGRSYPKKLCQMNTLCLKAWGSAVMEVFKFYMYLLFG